jgi:L-ascorbate metabolism protein UlaG (beta-lactamase superfamily)
MKIKWIGHSCFLITAKSGLKIITDPYSPGGGVQYEPVTDSADIVTVSHEHHDHNAVSEVKGNPKIVKGPGEHLVEGITISGLACHHDDMSGEQRGDNTIFCFTLDEVRICHSGDLGHRLSPEQLKEIGNVDVLLIPVGGYFTIDAKVATEVCNDLAPGIVIPMHYKTSKLAFPVVGVDDFLKGKANVKMVDSSEIDVEKGQLPGSTEIIVLQSAA